MHEDLNRELKDLKRRLDESDEAFVQRLADWQDWRKEIARIAERLTTIVVGDPTINHKGLVEKVQGHETFIIQARGIVEKVEEHDVFISEAKIKASETRGSRKTLLFICGVVGAILGKVLDFGFNYLSSHAGK